MGNAANEVEVLDEGVENTQMLSACCTGGSATNRS
jgi:putative radical SAM-modified peptide